MHTRPHLGRAACQRTGCVNKPGLAFFDSQTAQIRGGISSKLAPVLHNRGYSGSGREYEQCYVEGFIGEQNPVSALLQARERPVAVPVVKKYCPTPSCTRQAQRKAPRVAAADCPSTPHGPDLPFDLPSERAASWPNNLRCTLSRRTY